MPPRALPFLLALFHGLSGLGQDAGRAIATGDSLMALGRPQKALAAYNAAVKATPSAASYSARARAWMELDRLDKYLGDVNEALVLDSMHVEANYQRALYAYRGEDRHAAERLATRGLERATGELRRKLLVVRGMARSELRRHAGAIADLREGLGERTDDRPALQALAASLDQAKDHEGSLRVMEILCAVAPDDIGNWTNRGYELAQLGRHAEALEIYAKALAMDKDEPTALSNRSWSLLQLGREDEAMADVERSLRGYPSNPFALRTRAMIRLRRGQREKACADLSLAKILGEVPQVDQLLKEHCDGGTAK
ncbi:MAG TPA: tetratricopeptide repeat protein [Flavobacteriales bacterium]